ncbi:MAG: twin-arginine translocase TatA/TatE family subunit, partial [Actinomycetota bacterium]
MFPNVGLGELLVIVIVGLVVFGPKRLPGMMREAGKA